MGPRYSYMPNTWTNQSITSPVGKHTRGVVGHRLEAMASLSINRYTSYRIFQLVCSSSPVATSMNTLHATPKLWVISFEYSGAHMA